MIDPSIKSPRIGAGFTMITMIMKLTLATPAHAARFFLSLDETGAGPSRITVHPGFFQTVYIMVELEPGEIILSMGLSLHTDTPEAFAVLNSTILNPNHLLTNDQRWAETRVTEGTPGTGVLIGEMLGVYNDVAGSGLRGNWFVIGETLLNDPTYTPETGFARFGSFDLAVDATATRGNLWLSASQRGVAVEPTAPDQSDFIGMGDDQAPNDLFGPYGRPDGIFLPEPAGLALLALAFTSLRRQPNRPRQPHPRRLKK